MGGVLAGSQAEHWPGALIHVGRSVLVHSVSCIRFAFVDQVRARGGCTATGHSLIVEYFAIPNSTCTRVSGTISTGVLGNMISAQFRSHWMRASVIECTEQGSCSIGGHWKFERSVRVNTASLVNESLRFPFVRLQGNSFCEMISSSQFI